MDLITELPPSETYDAILVCVDRFTKMAHFIPTNSNVTVEQVASLYVKNVFRLHGLPKDIVSDHGQQFTSRFMKRLLELCDIKSNLSTAYHPQSDGQTERTNQTLEQYLHIYGDYQQDDWVELLPFAEFVYNNTESTSTKLTPFFACHGYHPRYTLTAFDSTDSVNPTAETLFEQFQHIHKYLHDNLQQAQDKYKEFHDRHAKEPPTFKVGDQVWLNRRNIRTKRPSQKLDAKKLGPFHIEEIVGESKLA
jgi:transposase InsO family protein